MHFFSRSRQELWHKGATSGNTSASKRSATTATATRCSRWSSPPGPACHTGERTCFHRGELEPAAPHEALPDARAHDRAARASRARRLLHGELLADPALAGAKVQEEAEEVVRAAREESDERVAEEAADVLYHLAVLLRGRGLTLADAERVLDGRRA